MSTNKLWQLPVVGRLGVQHGLLVGWFLLVAALAVMLVPGPAGSANAPTSLADPQTVDFGGQNHCGIVVGIGALGGFGSGDASCVSVESGNDSQVNTRGFGDIGMQFQNSPVGAPISNVHVSNFLGNNNSNNTIIGNQDLIISGNVGASAGLFGSAVAAAPDAPAAPAVAPPVTALPVADPAPAPVQPTAVDLGGQNHCGIVAGVGASSGGAGSGDTTCASVESGHDSQVNTRGFGDIGMQFQNSPVDAPITNVHISNTGNNNSNNTIVGDNNTVINFNFGIHV